MIKDRPIAGRPQINLARPVSIDIASLRASYRQARLDEADVENDPISQFRIWFEEAFTANVAEPNACTLATTTSDGRPSARTILLKGADEHGFSFYTNLESRKARELAENPHAALVFWWEPLERQVRIAGPVEPLSDAEADVYFASRPRESQLGAWASTQSRIVASRAELDEQLRQARTRFDGRDVERPPTWSGFRLRPTEVEFWQGREGRLHDRLAYRRNETAEDWQLVRLAP